MHRIVEEAHAEVTDLLTEHRDQLDGLAHALLEAETLDAPAAYAAAGVPLRTAELEATVASGPGVSFFGARRHPGVTPLPVEGRLPGFGSASGWLNSEPLTAAGLRGEVVLVDFWTYSCVNWLRTLAVRAGVGGSGMATAGLVASARGRAEFSFEHDLYNVRHGVRPSLTSAIRSSSTTSSRSGPLVRQPLLAGRCTSSTCGVGVSALTYFGEGDYDECERAIQHAAAGGRCRRRRPTSSSR